MKKYITVIIVLLIVALILTALVFYILKLQQEKKTFKVCIKQNCFKAEIAESLSDQIQGLMFRDNLPEDAGMLFIFDKEDKYSFWMKNTLIPLDVIWIDKDNRIVFISENNQPCNADICPNITPDEKAKYVLEINAGISKEMEFKVGDRVFIMLE